MQLPCSMPIEEGVVVQCPCSRVCGPVQVSRPEPKSAMHPYLKSCNVATADIYDTYPSLETHMIGIIIWQYSENLGKSEQLSSDMLSSVWSEGWRGAQSLAISSFSEGGGFHSAFVLANSAIFWLS